MAENCGRPATTSASRCPAHKPNLKAGDIIASDVIAEMVQRVVLNNEDPKKPCMGDTAKKHRRHDRPTGCSARPSQRLPSAHGAGDRGRERRKLLRSQAYGLLGVLLIAPTVLIFCAVIVYPLVSAIYLSASSRSTRRRCKGRWVGLDNYAALLASRRVLERALASTSSGPSARCPAGRARRRDGAAAAPEHRTSARWRAA